MLGGMQSLDDAGARLARLARPLTPGSLDDKPVPPAAIDGVGAHDNVSPPEPPRTLVGRAIDLSRFDPNPAHSQPSRLRVLVASVASVAGSLAADALLVVIGTAFFPSTKGYVHFQFHDYAKLTVVGVIIACAGWPVVARFTSAPRRVFLRLAVLVTLVLWLPDLYILYHGQSGEAVAVLMVMHLAIALVTYNLLVRVAPVIGPGDQKGKPEQSGSRSR